MHQKEHGTQEKLLLFLSKRPSVWDSHTQKEIHDIQILVIQFIIEYQDIKRHQTLTCFIVSALLDGIRSHLLYDSGIRIWRVMFSWSDTLQKMIGCQNGQK